MISVTESVNEDVALTSRISAGQSASRTKSLTNEGSLESIPAARAAHCSVE